VALDRRVVEGEPVVIVVGAIGFHYFAGFTGGRKGIFPGLGAYESVRENHRLVLDENGPGLHPACRPGSLEGNPVHEDMLDAIRFVPGRIFLVNAICNDDGEVTDVYTGDVIEAHAAGCEAYARAHTRRCDEPVDVLVVDAGGHPRDIDLVQVHKSLVHAMPAVRRGGTIVLRAACAEGIGSPTLASWFDEGDSRAIEKALRASYQLNSHTALSLRQCAERHDLAMVTSLPAALVERMGARVASSVDEALGAAARGGARRGLVITAPTSVRLRTPEASV
jgi:nickel-dependent lactate racemase